MTIKLTPSTFGCEREKTEKAAEAELSLRGFPKVIRFPQINDVVSCGATALDIGSFWHFCTSLVMLLCLPQTNQRCTLQYSLIIRGSCPQLICRGDGAPHTSLLYVIFLLRLVLMILYSNNHSYIIPDKQVLLLRIYFPRKARFALTKDQGVLLDKSHSAHF